METMEDILAKTEALWREGRYLDAWATLDNLYPEDTCEPDAIAMTLRLMPEVGELANWKHGDGLAHLLEFADGDDFKIAAAEWRVEYAAFLLGIGKAKMALHEFGRAVDLWEPIRMRYVDDDRLRGLV